VRRPTEREPAGGFVYNPRLKPERIRVRNSLVALVGLSVCAAAFAAPVTYDVDPEHTYPSFEADHMGMSMWRGRFNRTSGKVTMDKTAGTGTLDIVIDAASIDFGHPKLAEYLIGPDQLDAKKFPTMTYRGRLARFVDGAPTEAQGDLTMHGVTRPVALKINMFKCIPHPLFKREWCGADASGTLDRSKFGLDYAPQWGFKPEVTLRIQVEALAGPK
jgi:polyisoprenoid-binding protein YceI